MKKMIENQNNYDIIVDDGGRLYLLKFIDGPMTEQEVIDDFIDGYDGDISIEDIDVVFPDK